MTKGHASPYPEFVANLKVSGEQTGIPKSPPSADLGKKLSEGKCLLALLMTVTQEYLARLQRDLLSPQQSLAVRMCCLWMRTAQGNGPLLQQSTFWSNSSRKVIHKEMVSGNMLMGRSCSSFLSQAQLLQGLERAWPLVASLVISLCEQLLLPPAFCNQNQFHWSVTDPNLTKKVPAQGEG